MVKIREKCENCVAIGDTRKVLKSYSDNHGIKDLLQKVSNCHSCYNQEKAYNRRMNKNMIWEDTPTIKCKRTLFWK